MGFNSAFKGLMEQNRSYFRPQHKVTFRSFNTSLHVTSPRKFTSQMWTLLLFNYFFAPIQCSIAGPTGRAA